MEHVHTSYVTSNDPIIVSSVCLVIFIWTAHVNVRLRIMTAEFKVNFTTLESNYTLDPSVFQMGTTNSTRIMVALNVCVIETVENLHLHHCCDRWTELKAEESVGINSFSLGLIYTNQNSSRTLYIERESLHKNSAGV